MRIEQRLRRLERSLGARGACTCANRLRVYYTPAIFPGQSDVCPPAVCEICGGALVVVNIVYVENWRE